MRQSYPTHRRQTTPTRPGLRPSTAGVLLDALLAAPVPARYCDFERGRRKLAKVCGRGPEYALAERHLQRGLGL